MHNSDSDTGDCFSHRVRKESVRLLARMLGVYMYYIFGTQFWFDITDPSSYRCYHDLSGVLCPFRGL